jgi:hypothetical protein
MAAEEADKRRLEMTMKTSRHLTLLILLYLAAAERLEAAAKSLTPIRMTSTRGAYQIETIGDTLGQSSPQNTRLIIRVFGPDKKVVKPAEIALIDKSSAVIKPVFREDRKVGHEENTGLPLSITPQASTNGYGGTGVGVNLNKIFGPKGSYSYTKVDWPKLDFTADKQLQIVLSNGQSFLLPLTSLAK